MAIFHYRCRVTGGLLPSDNENHVADPLELADKHFYERPAIAALVNEIKAGDTLVMDFQEIVPLGKAMCVLNMFNDQGVRIEFTGTEPRLSTLRGVMASEYFTQHIAGCVNDSKAVWKSEAKFEADCN